MSLLGKSQVDFRETGLEYELQVPLSEAARGTEGTKPFASGIPC